MDLPRIMLAATAAVFGLFGAGFALFPVELAELVDLQLATSTARIEIAAIYGGMQLGIAAFLAYCAAARGRVRIGLTAAALMLGGAATLRLAGVAMDSGVRPAMYLFVAMEATGAALCGWAARWGRRPWASEGAAG